MIKKISFIVGALLCTSFQLRASELDHDEMDPIKTAQNYISSLEKDGTEYSFDPCNKLNCCKVTDTEECSIDEFEKDQTMMVYPGGETRCIFSYSGDFAFQVVPGASDKVLVYFQGGGACWNEASSKLHLCRVHASPLPELGVFNRSNEKNKFKDYTIVNVLYCSGDVHGGNTVRPYNDRDGVPVEQKGLVNTQTTLDWLVKQQAEGNLAATLSELVVMGCSAGSIGAQLWGKQVLSALKWEKAAVVPDSYAGVFPEGSIGPIVYEYGFCNSGFLSPELTEKCNNQTIELKDMNLEFIAATPTVPYAFLQSKIDVIQRTFFMAIALLSGYEDKDMSPEIFYEDVNEIFGAYHAELDNFVAYLVDGHDHCYTPREVYFVADPLSNHDNAVEPRMHDWVGQVPLANGDTISTVCEGDLQRTAMNTRGATSTATGTARTTSSTRASIGKSGNDTNAYCSTSVYPSTFTEQY